MQACSCGGGGSLPKSLARAAMKSERISMCPGDVASECDALWGAAPLTLASGASGVLTWDTVGVFFSQLAPVALILNVTAQGRNSALDPATGLYTQTVREPGLNDLIQIDEINYQGKNYLASKVPVNLETFRCCNTMLGIGCFGVIQPSTNDIEVNLTNVADPAAVTFDLQVSGTIIGYEVRGGSVITPYGAISCEDWEAGRIPGLGKIPPGTSIEARFKANVGKSTGGAPGNGGAWRPEP